MINTGNSMDSRIRYIGDDINNKVIAYISKTIDEIDIKPEDEQREILIDMLTALTYLYTDTNPNKAMNLFKTTRVSKAKTDEIIKDILNEIKAG